MKGLKRNYRKRKYLEKGFSLISAILVILIIFICFLIFLSFSNSEDTNFVAEYQNYFEDELKSTENVALRYYYNQLEEPAKIMYTTILENVESLKSGTESIKFPSSVSDSILEIGGSEEDNYFQSAWDALSLDDLELFFVDTSKLSISTRTSSFLSYKSYGFTLSPQSGTNYYNSSFSSEEEINNAINEVQKVADEVVASATGSRYNKILYVHDWLVDNLEYDSSNNNKDNIYGTFIDNKVVCEGYAEGLKYLLDKLNIPCVLVYGVGYDEKGNEEAHAWNYVQMEDGKWYAVDVTWDDPVFVGGSNSSILQNQYKHSYLLKGSKTFNVNHISDGDVSGSGQNFKYPELSEDDYK